MRDMDPSVRAALGYQEEFGAAVIGVSPGSPALSAGLQPWDVVESVNGEKIRTSTQLFSLVQRTRIGETLKLDVWRKGESLQLSAVITENHVQSSQGKSPETSSTQGRTYDPEQVLEALGIQVRDLSVQERMHGFRGVAVTGVAENALATEQIKAGDLVVAVNNSRISGANEFFHHLAASAAVQDTSLHLIREGQVLRINLPAVPRQQ